MNALPPSRPVLPNDSYQATRFNALRHGVLSGHTVLPWEDRHEYQTLLDALVAEHAPSGPTEEHLVEELVGIIWRKRRLRQAEAAIFKEQLRKDVGTTYEPQHIAGAALLPVTGKAAVKADVAMAFAASASDTARDLRAVKRDQAMTNKAQNILAAGGANVYDRALQALRDDTRSYWLQCVNAEDETSCQPTAESLGGWLRRHWKEWFEDPILELEHRDAIKQQAFGSAYATRRLEITARYEVHLDRKFERTLSTLIRLRDLRLPVPSA